MKCLTLYTKINSKWKKELNVRSETVKLLEEHIGEMFHDIGLGNDFLDMMPKSTDWPQNQKLASGTASNPKAFAQQMKTSNKIKSQPIKWKKIFVNHVSDKGLIQENPVTH